MERERERESILAFCINLAGLIREVGSLMDVVGRCAESMGRLSELGRWAAVRLSDT